MISSQSDILLEAAVEQTNTIKNYPILNEETEISKNECRIIERVKETSLFLVCLAAFIYNIVFRVSLMTGYLSSSASFIAGILAGIAWRQHKTKSLIIVSNPSSTPFVSKLTFLPNSVYQWAQRLMDLKVFLLNIGVVLVCFISFLCYIVIVAIVYSGKDEFISTMLWYLIGFAMSILLLYQHIFYRTNQDTQNRVVPQPKITIRQKTANFAKWFTIGLFYLLFLFTMADSCFRANAYVKYYKTADRHVVYDTSLQFDCFCAGDGEQRPFGTCLTMHRLKSNDDRVLIFEHGLGSNSFLQRKLMRYLSVKVPSYIFCTYNRRMHAFSDRLSWSQLQSFVTASESVFYLRAWIRNQNLNRPIIYAGHSYGSFHLAEMAIRSPSLVKGLIMVDGSWINGKPSWIGGDWLISPHIQNVVGLLSGLPLSIVGSISYDSFLSLTGQRDNDNLAFDSRDGPELIASLAILNFLEITIRDYYLGIVNSNIMLTYNLQEMKDNKEKISTPTLLVYVNYGSINDPKNYTTKWEHERVSPDFFRNISYVPVYGTTHAGILTRRWEETGNAIVDFIKSID